MALYMYFPGNIRTIFTKAQGMVFDIFYECNNQYISIVPRNSDELIECKTSSISSFNRNGRKFFLC